MFLYIDTTDKITLGLLNDKMNWIDYFHDPKLVISTTLHFLIDDMLKRHDLKISDITSTIYMAGPGSYTGMRVSEGISDIFKWQNMQVNSFYHHEVARLNGESRGKWISKAFKGEYFLFSWDGEKEEQILIKESDLKEYIKPDDKTFSFHNVFDFPVLSTVDMIRNNPQAILTSVLNENLNRRLYYYRELNQEFQKC